ncbi:dynein regulatory complex protein 10 isoform X1 [Acipenser oxyrinchus oxyrinchus]|uniref:Dynein regulatory complex protein 10 n=1 Tax=Acipenser oxyrinchus oxyrinchus TaxID=40147 RepID=A0AAD8CWE2_ACIOX|nr:dynein regulatory complex protein 10 isoform X1 [Acipenser oxyrinchus oxyrinchus]
MAAELAVLPQQLDDPAQLKGSHTPQPRTRAAKDSLKILDPASKKLSCLEAQRIASVLEECIRKAELSTLLPYCLHSLDRFGVVLGAELTGALQEHRRLGDNLQTLLERQEPRWGEMGALQQAIRSSLRNVLRLFQANPVACQTLRAEKGKCDPAGQELVRGLTELRGIVFDKLLTGPAEDCERARYVQEVALQHHKNMVVVSALEADVEATIQDRDTEISKKNEMIRQLKSSLHQTEKLSDDFLKKTGQESDKQLQSDQKASEVKCGKLQQEITQLRSQLNNLITENCESELALRKRKYKVETEIENWIQKYDADMGEKQVELEQLHAVYTEEQGELKELEEHFAVLDQEYSQIMEERHLAQVKKEQEERELILMIRVTTRIQALWKGYKVRKMMKSKKKGKKGKGKKGKGKKGKK